jgi:hypothetical protein
MTRRHCILVVGAWLLLAAAAAGADVPVRTASGTVRKATANVLFVHPRGPDGRFQDVLTLKLSGTSKVYMLTAQMRGGKPLLVQKETEPQTLQANQTIALIYAVMKDDLVLLSAVAQPLGTK